MLGIYAVFAAAALFSVLVGAIGGGVWWAVTAVGLVMIAGWLVVDRSVKRREPGGDRGVVQSKPQS